MTVKELQDFLKKVEYPEDAEVLFDLPEFEYHLSTRDVEYSRSLNGDSVEKIIITPETE